MENLSKDTRDALESDVNDIELTLPARLDRLHVVRSLAAAVLLTEDFDLDTVADLKVGVDQACTELITLGELVGASTLHVRLRVGSEQVSIEVSCDVGDATLDTSSFGWYVIECVADDVSVTYTAGTGTRAAGIKLTTRRG